MAIDVSSDGSAAATAVGYAPWQPRSGPFSTAIEMLDALEARHVSAVELVEDHLAWIDKHDGVLNAIPVRTPERALEAAKRADEHALQASDGRSSACP